MRSPSPAQRKALWLIAQGHADHANIPEMMAPGADYDHVRGALFLVRLLDKGWLEFRITDDGYEALGYVPCRGCGEWCDPEDNKHLAHIEPGR
jgi:hypothetical protein